MPDLKPVHLSKMDRSFSKSGVYVLFDRGKAVYVGQSANVLRRVGEHISDRRKRFCSVAFVPCTTLNRLWFESHYITHFKPIYNLDPASAPRPYAGKKKFIRRSRWTKPRAVAA